MSEKLGDFASMIPEAYYDLLARFTVGFITLLLIFVMYSDQLNITSSSSSEFVKPVILIPTFLILSYVFGFLISSIAIFIESIFRWGYNPMCALIAEKPVKASYWHKSIRLLEIILGFPFSILILREFLRDSFPSGLITQINKKIDDNFGSVEGYWRAIRCRDYVRDKNERFGAILTKMKAESDMCRGLAFIFFLSGLAFFIKSNIIGASTTMLLGTLSFSVFSYRRRVMAENIFTFFITVK